MVAMIARAGFKRSAELMRQRNRPAADGFERGELEVEFGVDAIDLRALNERIHHGGHLDAALGARAAMILASDHDATQCTLRTVAVERHIRIGREDPKAIEVVLDIFRSVVERVDFDSERNRRGTLDVAGHRVCWSIEGSPPKSLVVGTLAEP